MQFELLKPSIKETKMRLEAFQEAAVTDILTELEKSGKACLAYYTGSGKTNIFLEAASRIIDKNPKAKIGISAYLTNEIKDQTTERMNQFWNKYAGNIEIFIPQNIYNKKKESKFDYLFIDEFHAGASDGCIMINNIIAAHCKKDVKILLISATPWDALRSKKFDGTKTFKRSIELGLKDGRVADVEMYLEKADFELKEHEFTRTGEAKNSALILRHALVRSACIGKMKNLLSRYNKELGDKVIVICPPGNTGEVARSLAKEFNGLAFIELVGRKGSEEFDTRENLEIFKKTDCRFLFVINKCGVGFDMPELSSVIDLTMTRNIMRLVQRIGRVSREYKGKQKRYFYVTDSGLSDIRAEWIIGTCLDFSIGNYDGWSSRSVKYRPLKRYRQFRFQKSSFKISEIIKSLAPKESVRNVITIKYTEGTPPKIRTIKSALEEAKQYTNRHELFKKNPALYKWFRLNDRMAELTEIHPHVNPRKWNEKTVLEAVKKAKSRTDFHDNFCGASDWVLKHQRHDLLDKYLGRANTIWNEDKIKKVMAKCSSWQEFRDKHDGARAWLCRNGKLQEYKRMMKSK